MSGFGPIFEAKAAVDTNAEMEKLIGGVVLDQFV